MFNFTIDRPGTMFFALFSRGPYSFFVISSASLLNKFFYLMYERMLILNIDSLYKSNDLFFSFTRAHTHARTLLFSKTWTKHSTIPFFIRMEAIKFLSFSSSFFYFIYTQPDSDWFSEKKACSCIHELIFMSILFFSPYISLQATFIAQYSTKTLSIERICHGWWSTRKSIILYINTYYSSIFSWKSQENAVKIFVKCLSTVSKQARKQGNEKVTFSQHRSNL